MTITKIAFTTPKLSEQEEDLPHFLSTMEQDRKTGALRGFAAHLLSQFRFSRRTALSQKDETIRDLMLKTPPKGEGCKNKAISLLRTKESKEPAHHEKSVICEAIQGVNPLVVHRLEHAFGSRIANAAGAITLSSVNYSPNNHADDALRDSVVSGLSSTLVEMASEHPIESMIELIGVGSRVPTAVYLSAFLFADALVSEFDQHYNSLSTQNQEEVRTTYNFLALSDPGANSFNGVYALSKAAQFPGKLLHEISHAIAHAAIKKLDQLGITTASLSKIEEVPGYRIMSKEQKEVFNECVRQISSMDPGQEVHLETALYIARAIQVIGQAIASGLKNIKDSIEVD